MYMFTYNYTQICIRISQNENTLLCRYTSQVASFLQIFKFPSGKHPAWWKYNSKNTNVYIVPHKHLVKIYSKIVFVYIVARAFKQKNILRCVAGKIFV